MMVNTNVNIPYMDPMGNLDNFLDFSDATGWTEASQSIMFPKHSMYGIFLATFTIKKISQTVGKHTIHYMDGIGYVGLLPLWLSCV